MANSKNDRQTKQLIYKKDKMSSRLNSKEMKCQVDKMFLHQSEYSLNDKINDPFKAEGTDNLKKD